MGTTFINTTMLTILNSSVLTEFGDYRYSPLTLAEASQLLKEEGYSSAIGHEENARLLSVLTGLQIPVNRVEYRQRPGEKALVFKIKKRLPAGEIIGNEDLPQEEYETGLLERLK